MPQILESLRKLWLEMLQTLHERFKKGDISEQEYETLTDNLLDEILKIDEQSNQQ